MQPPAKHTGWVVDLHPTRTAPPEHPRRNPWQAGWRDPLGTYHSLLAHPNRWQYLLLVVATLLGLSLLDSGTSHPSLPGLYPIFLGRLTLWLVLLHGLLPVVVWVVGRWLGGGGTVREVRLALLAGSLPALPFAALVLAYLLLDQLTFTSLSWSDPAHWLSHFWVLAVVACWAWQTFNTTLALAEALELPTATAFWSLSLGVVTFAPPAGLVLLLLA